MDGNQLELPTVTVETALTGLGVLIGGFVLALLIERVARRVLRWRGRGESSVQVFSSLASWLTIFLSVAAALTVVFPSIRPVNILGGVGVISIAAGIAFQTVLGNMFAGMVLLYRDRLRIGDQVSVQEVRGAIVAMDLSSTTVRTFDGRQVLIPNSVMHSEVITVQTGYEAVRTTVYVDLAETVDLRAAQELAVAAMDRCGETLPEPRPQALLSEIGSGTVRMELRFWSGARQFETREAQHAVIVAVMEEYAEHSVATGSDVLVVRLDSSPNPTPN